eukprot:GFKZ01000446.1.p1 GENE.GFKZ01000446.1~~GFKZ01000446.1.p1  ORF type:complete len:517 (-),score=86.39 GFKZ01000446.1:128-1678(-)
MGVSDSPLSSSPWTVVLQGTSVKYEEATQLDKLEYALRKGGPAVERHLNQTAIIEGVSGALSEAARNLTNSDSLIRAGKLLVPVVEFSTSKDRAPQLSAFLAGLGSELLTPYVDVLKNDKDVSSWYLAAVGGLLGHKSIASFAKSKGLYDLLVEQKTKYVAAVASALANITEDSMLARPEEDDDEKQPGSATAPRPAALSPSLSANLGYIPTVAGISAVPQQGYSSSSDEQLGRILSGVANFLSSDENRFIFCKVSSASPSGGRGPTVLAALLDKDVRLPVQVYYQTVFCLWLLTFTNQQEDAAAVSETISQALEEAAVPRRLTNVLREVSAEKVVRISLSTLRNILKMSTTLRKEMVGAGLVGALESLCLRRWSDEDIREDLGVLAEALETELASMSNFDVYRAEVLSGALEWTPAHRDEMFWRENVEKLERNQQEVLRCMVRLLHESTDDTVLAVACNDLSQFIKFHPRGRAIAQSLGVKSRLMELMIDGEGDVRRYALNCVQVLMIRWNRQES